MAVPSGPLLPRLRALDPVQLAGLLEGVPGLLASATGNGPLALTWPVLRLDEPQSLPRLARQLGGPLGIRLTWFGLDAFTAQLATVAAWHGGRLTRAQALAETGGAHAEALDRAAAVLRDRLLAEDDGWLSLRPPVVDVAQVRSQGARHWLRHLSTGELGIIAANLGAVDLPARHGERLALIEAMLRRRDVLDEVLARMPADSRRLLDRLLADGPQRVRDLGFDYVSPYAAPGSRSAPIEWLRSHGLVDVDYGEQVVGVFLDVVVGANGGRLHTRWEPAPPAVEARALAEAGVRVPPVVEHLGTLLETWAVEPPDALANGGLGVRPVRATAKRLGLPAGAVGLLAHLAIRIGVLGRLHVGTKGRGRSAAPVFRWSATELASAWRDEPAAVRWALLVQAWRDDIHLDEDEGLPERASDELAQHAGTTPWLARDALLRLLAEQPEGTGLTEGALRELAGWRLPSLLDAQRLEGLLAAARVLGVVPPEGPVGLTAAARALLDSPEALGALLPEGRRELVVQGDGTVITPPDAHADLTTELARYADLESDAGARVWRLSEGRIARALDDGAEAEAIETFLREHATAPLPQNVTYLLADAARRHGRVRAGAVGAYLRSDDPALLSAAVAVRAAKLRLLAPTVAVSPLSRAKLLAALRDRGVSAVAEDADGTTISAAPKAAAPLTARRSGEAPALPVVRPGPDPLAVAHRLLSDDDGDPR